MIGTNGFRVGAALHDKVDGARRVNLCYVQARHYRGKARRSCVSLSPILGRVEAPVLIIDDIIDTGDTIRAVKRRIGKRRADVAVLFVKPWSRVRPDYCVKEIDGWVVFPWERTER